MPDNAVTHEMLRAGQLALIDRFDAHEKRFGETTAKLFDKVDRAIEASHANALAISKIDAGLVRMADDRPGYVQELRDLRKDVDALKGEQHERKGERGVLAAIAKSPLIAWLFAVAGAVWALLKSGQGSAGQ